MLAAHVFFAYELLGPCRRVIFSYEALTAQGIMTGAPALHPERETERPRV